MKSETKRPLDVLLRAVANPIIALILAFLLSGLVVLISGDDPMGGLRCHFAGRVRLEEQSHQHRALYAADLDAGALVYPV